MEKRAKYYIKINNTIDIYIYHLNLGLKNYSENKIVASDLCQLQFYMKLAKARIDSKIINYYIKNQKLI